MDAPSQKSGHQLSKGIGELLLMDALARCAAVSKQVACAAVIVDAKDDTAKRFYMKYGFMALPGVDRRLFIPIDTVEAVVRGWWLEDSAGEGAGNTDGRGIRTSRRDKNHLCASHQEG